MIILTPLCGPGYLAALGSGGSLSTPLPKALPGWESHTTADSSVVVTYHGSMRYWSNGMFSSGGDIP